MTRKKQIYVSDNEVRLQRVNLWLDRADLAKKDPHFEKKDKSAVRFVFYWIAFEAAFETQMGNNSKQLMERFIKDAVGNARKNRKGQSKFDKLLDHKDKGKFYQSSIELLKLRGTHEWFWKKPKSPKVKTHEAWKRLFDQEIKDFPGQDSSEQLCVIFKRLKVVRNQIFHGASSMDMSKGKPQVEAGLRILSIVIPEFRRVIKDNQEKIDWNPVPYPRVSKTSSPLW